MTEKNNPVLPVTESAGNHGIRSTDGTLDTERPGMAAVLIDVTASKERPAPENPRLTWSADSPY